MATTAPANNAASPRWSDLPFDLLCDISSRLHVATDYIRFHAVCQPWRDTLPPLPCRPAFLPLLLAPADAIGHQTARCIFSPKCSRRRSAAVEIAVGRRVWVMSLDGASTSFFLLAISRESTSLVNPLSGSTVAALPPLPDGVKYVSGVVSVDGTVFLFGLFPEKMAFWTPIFVALLRPGSTVWTSARTHHRLIHDVRNLDRYSIAYRDGMIVVCCNHDGWCKILPKRDEGYGYYHQQMHHTPGEVGKKFHCMYNVESRGELLLVCVRVKD